MILAPKKRSGTFSASASSIDGKTSLTPFFPVADQSAASRALGWGPRRPRACAHGYRSIGRFAGSGLGAEETTGLRPWLSINRPLRGLWIGGRGDHGLAPVAIDQSAASRALGWGSSRPRACARGYRSIGRFAGSGLGAEQTTGLRPWLSISRPLRGLWVGGRGDHGLAPVAIDQSAASRALGWGPRRPRACARGYRSIGRFAGSGQVRAGLPRGGLCWPLQENLGYAIGESRFLAVATTSQAPGKCPWLQREGLCSAATLLRLQGLHVLAHRRFSLDIGLGGW